MHLTDAIRTARRAANATDTLRHIISYDDPDTDGRTYGVTTPDYVDSDEFAAFDSQVEADVLPDGTLDWHPEASRPFTVVLLYPDYATGDFGADVSVQVRHAATYEQAVLDAQAAVVADNPNLIHDATDLRPILVFAGECECVADATCF